MHKETLVLELEVAMIEELFSMWTCVVAKFV
jgi:hypothetical protein